MVDVLEWQIQKRFWLALAGVVVVATSGCKSSVSEPRLPEQSSQASDQADDVAASALRSTHLKTLIEESKQAFELGNLDEAIEKYTTVLRNQPSGVMDSIDVDSLNAEVFQLRGMAFLEKGFPQIAIDDFDESIRLGSDELNARTYLLRAKAEFSLQQWSLVVRDCGQSIRLNPSDGEAFLVRGRALEAMGQSGRAIDSFLESERLGVVVQTRLKPIVKSAPSVLAEARLSLEAGVPGVAREILEKAILEGNDSSEIRGLLAETQFQLQEFYLAIEASTRAIESNPQFANAYRIRGEASLQRGSFDQAIADLTAAIVLDETLAEPLEPVLAEARRRGGIDPVVRASMTSRIRKLVASKNKDTSLPGPSEQWLLELIEKHKSSDQVEQLKALLAATPETDFDSLGWLADFLMLDYRAPAVKELRNYLERETADVSTLEKRLWESVKSRVAAASSGVNLFPDLAAYAIEYEYLNLLRKSIDLDVSNINFDHVYHSIANDNTEGLRLVLPQADLLAREIPGLLRYCVENNRPEHAMIIIDRYPKSLTWELIEFLAMTGKQT